MRKTKSITRNHPAIFLFFEIIKIIFHGDCWSLLAIADSNKDVSPAKPLYGRMSA